MKTSHYTKPGSLPKLLPSLMLLIVLFIQINVYSQSISLLSPNGGENWLTGTTQTISWSLNGDPSDIMIEYSTDGGVYYYYLGYVSAYDSTDVYSFMNYISASEQVKIKVSLYNNNSVSDESDSVFTVTQSPVYFYDPWAGDSYYRTSPVYISWYSPDIPVCDIDYTTDNGSSWQNIITNFEGSSYEWTAADVISDSCMIRISENGNASNYGLSPMFSITDLPTLSLLAPNGGETWNYGELGQVSWTGTNLPYYLYLDYSLDNGQSWNYLGYAYSSDTGGSTNVYVPRVSSTEALVRIMDPGFDQINDESDNTFTIFTPPVIMYYPSEGDEFYNKSTTYISWIATGVDSVNIELSTDNGQSWTIIETGLDAYYGYYYWTISAIPSNQCIIKVSDVSDATKFGLSGVFSILPTPVLEITSPQAGDIWNTDSAYTITWNYDNEDSWYIDLEYSIDNGQTWNYMGWVYNTVPVGSFTWTTPEVESEQCLIRVYDYYYDFVADTSELFTIREFPATPICMVSVDDTANQNIIIWDKPASPLIDTFIVYRESTSASVYEPIGYISYGDSSIFTDEDSNPTIKPYRYKLGYKDIDGNIYPMGQFHQTIHLSINKGVGNSWNLSWTDYIGFALNTYNIYRKTDTSDFEFIGSISASFSSYTDFGAPETDVYYVVEAENPLGCGPLLKAGGIYASRSNVVKNSSFGTDEINEHISFNLYPNPANNQITIELTGDNIDRLVTELIDVRGNILLSEEHSNISSSESININTSGLKNGLYLLRTYSERSSSISKVIIQH